MLSRKVVTGDEVLIDGKWYHVVAVGIRQRKQKRWEVLVWEAEGKLATFSFSSVKNVRSANELDGGAPSESQIESALKIWKNSFESHNNLDVECLATSRPKRISAAQPEPKHTTVGKPKPKSKPKPKPPDETECQPKKKSRKKEKMESESEDVQSDSETETDEETPKRKVLSCCNA